MEKIKSLDELKKINEEYKAKINIRNSAENKDRIVIAVGMATCGIAAGAREILEVLNEEVLANKLDNVSVMATGCLGYCYAEPMVEIRYANKDAVLYGNVDKERAKRIITEHIMEGKMIDNAIIGR